MPPDVCTGDDSCTLPEHWKDPAFSGPHRGPNGDSSMSETAGEAPLDGAAFDALPGTEHAVDLPEGMQSPDTRPEMVRHPDHYGGDTTYEVIKCLEAWGLDADAYLFNVVKYVARAGKKGSVIEDLKKAEFYLQRKIKNLEAQQ